MVKEKLFKNSRSETTTTPKLDYDLVIVGGGIAGTALACALKNSGLKIALVETKPKSVVAGKKLAYNLSLVSGRILDGIGVWQKILPKITTYQQISLSDGNYPRTVQFYPDDLVATGKKLNPKEGLGYVGEHQVMLSAMQEFLTDSDQLTWLCPVEVLGVNYQSDFVEVQLKHKETNNLSDQEATFSIRSKLVVGADGARSPIRETAGIETHGWKYWQSCIAMTIKIEKSHHNIAFERFWPSGPMGVLPLPGNRCQVVWTAPHTEAKALQELEPEKFLAKLEERTGGLLGKVELLSDRYVFPVQLMQSDRYVQHRLALIGDAAHCCHPVGGQGLNMGIRDVGAIAEILKSAHQQGEDLGGLRVLKRYESWRRKENLVILAVTDFLDRMFSGTLLPIVAIRRLGLWGMGIIPMFKSLSLRVMTGLFGRHPELARN
ncbi:FAD-dependent hydroxylase [Okeania sp.]|uniref:FAD-dependent hydroxylase n=1 Tax=Okeania sp. TaxID=3100323 RepID=UPI002B4ABF98|nr:FAD-dependent hydroxylase [Okeania sp.]MEB3341171.1 FAD-dependent hydroxylase [Okeania sp.]